MSGFNHIVFCILCACSFMPVCAQHSTDSLIKSWEATGVPPDKKKEYKEFLETKERREHWRKHLIDEPTQKSSAGNSVLADSCANSGFENGDYSYWYRFEGSTSGGSNCPSAYYSLNGYTPGGNGNMTYNSSEQNSSIYVINTNVSSGAAVQFGNDALCITNQNTFPLPQINVGSASARINNATAGGKAVKAEYVYQVPLNKPYFVFDWAAVMSDGGHETGDQAAIRIQVKTMQGTLLNIPNAEIIHDVNDAIGSSDWIKSTAKEDGDEVYYHPWRRDTIELCPYAGQKIRIAFEALDCSFGGHFCYMYLDARCNYEAQSPASVTQNVQCPDLNNFLLTATAGYVAYQWLDAAGNYISAAQTGTNQMLDLNAYVSNCPGGNCSVNEGDVFSVLLFSQFGCSLKVDHTIQFNEVVLQGSSVTPTCKEATNGEISVSASGGLGTGTYNFQWYQGSCNGTVIGTDSLLDNINAGTYCVLITSGNCPPHSQTFTVNLTPMQVDHVTQSFPPCLDSAMALTVAGNNAPFAWYQNSYLLSSQTGDSLWVDPFNHPDLYSATFYGDDGCKDSTVFHTNMSGAEKKFESMYCPGDSIALVYIPPSYGASNVQWYLNSIAVSDSAGGENDTISASIVPSAIGNYFVTWEENGCKKIAWKFDQQFPSDIFTPDTTVSIFTPNNDGINDVFYPFAEKEFSGGEIEKESASYKLFVYNRWGILVYESGNYSSGWSGKAFMNELAAEGTYFWIAEFESNCRRDDPVTRKKGYVQLLR